MKKRDLTVLLRGLFHFVTDRFNCNSAVSPDPLIIHLQMFARFTINNSEQEALVLLLCLLYTT